MSEVSLYRSVTFGAERLADLVSPNRVRQDYRGTSLIRNRHPVGPYSRPSPRALWWS